MSLFGESSEDKRDYGFAFGAFKGTTYLGLVMASKGLLSPLDAAELKKQMLDGIEIVPDEHLSSKGRAAVTEALETVERMAASNFVPGR